MTEERKNELNEMMDNGDFDALEKITDHDEQCYIIQQMSSKMSGGKIKDEETKNNIIKDCVAQLDLIKGNDAVKAWLDTYTVKDERVYAQHVFKLMYAFRTNDVEEMLKYLEDIKQLPRELLPEDILRRIDQLEKIKGMDAEEMKGLNMEGVNMIKALIDNIMTVYKEHEILFDITKIAIDMHVYTDKETIIRARITTPEIEEAYAKHNS